MTPPTITLITRDAVSSDTLTDADYRDIYAELRQSDLPIGKRRSLRQFTALIGEPPSIAYWSKYEADPDMTLSRMAKNRLRSLYTLPDLPLTVRDALADVHPDAAIWRIGADGAPHTVILVAGDEDPVDIHVNHTISLIDPASTVGVVHEPPTPTEPAQESDVTPRTTPRDRHTVSLPSSIYLRLDAARKRAGLTWPAYAAHLQEIADAHQPA